MSRSSIRRAQRTRQAELMSAGEYEPKCGTSHFQRSDVEQVLVSESRGTAVLNASSLSRVLVAKNAEKQRSACPPTFAFVDQATPWKPVSPDNLPETF